MKLIIEVNGIRRLVNKGFRIYEDAQALTLTRDALNEGICKGLDPGWGKIGENIQVADTTSYAWDATTTDKPIYPFTPKI